MSCLSPEIHPHEEKGDNKDGYKGNANGVEGVLPHGEVLLIEDVEDGIGEDVDVVLRRSADVDPLGDRVGELARPSQSSVVVLRILQDCVECHEVV